VEQEKYDTHPWTVHGCLMSFEEELRTNLGSAILINPEYVLTAAHTVYNKKAGRVVDQVSFYPYNHGNDILRVVRGKIIIMYRDYYENETENKDIALIKLETPIPFETYAILDLTEETQHNLITNSVPINVTGYPGFPPFFGRYMTSIPCSFEKDCRIEDGKLYYKKGDWYKGYSGSGIWFEFRDKCYLIGIHTACSKYGTESIEGIGIFFDKTIVNNIQIWMNRLNSM
jgi:V8-like Glu-specific endopeptidase